MGHGASGLLDRYDDLSKYGNTQWDGALILVKRLLLMKIHFLSRHAHLYSPPFTLAESSCV